MNNKVILTVSIVIVSVVVMAILTIYWPKNIENIFFTHVEKNISKIPKEIFLDLRPDISPTKISLEPDQNPDTKVGSEKDSKTSITKLGNFTDLEIMRDFFISDSLETPGILESKKYDVHKAIAKNGHSVDETKTERSFLYYFPEYNNFTWSVENNWLLRDITNDKYYVPEGLIKFDKGLLFEWTPLKNFDKEKEIEFIIIS